MDSMNMIVAKNIKRLREENKLSMDELASSAVSARVCLRRLSAEMEILRYLHYGKFQME